MARRTTVAYAALAVADTMLAATWRGRQRWLTKPLLMPGGLCRRTTEKNTPGSRRQAPAIRSGNTGTAGNVHPNPAPQASRLP